MRLEYALKRLEWAAHKILREGDLAADLPPDITALRDQAWTAPFPEQSGVANPRFKTPELPKYLTTFFHLRAVIEIAGIELPRQDRAVGTLARQRTRSRCVQLW